MEYLPVHHGSCFLTPGAVPNAKSLRQKKVFSNHLTNKNGNRLFLSFVKSNSEPVHNTHSPDAMSSFFLTGGRSFLCCKGKRGSFDAPKNYYFIKTGNRLRKVHPRLVSKTNMPQPDLPFSFGYFVFCWQISYARGDIIPSQRKKVSIVRCDFFIQLGSRRFT